MKSFNHLSENLDKLPYCYLFSRDLIFAILLKNGEKSLRENEPHEI